MLSIIVPIHNSGHFIEECILSLMNQTYSDIEILLINDASDDNSGEICDFYAEKDSRIRIFNSSKHGVSHARNIGIRAAFGEYIVFCDSDDTLEPEFCSTLVGLSADDKTLAACGYRHMGTQKSFVFSDEHTSLIRKEDFLEAYNKYLINPVINKLYSVQILREKNIFFDEEAELGEDLLFNLAVLRNTDGIIFINKVLYNYRVSENGTLSTKYRPDIQAVQMSIFSELESFINENNICKNAGYYYMYMRLLNNIFNNNLHIDSPMNRLRAVSENSRILRRDKVIRNISSEINPICRAAYKSGCFSAVYLYNNIASFKRRKRRKKIFLRAYLKCNFGDDLLVDILVRRYTDTKFFVVGSDKEAFSYNPNITVINENGLLYRIVDHFLRKKNLNAGMVINRCCDGAVYVGGSIFMQSPTHEKSIKAFCNFYNPGFTAVLGCNFGPFTDEYFIRDYRHAFERLDDICFRDRYSYELFLEMECARYAPDIAFLAPRTKLVTQQKVFISVIGLRERTGLSEYEERYKNKLTDISNYFTDKGYIVELASLCRFEGDEEMAGAIIKSPRLKNAECVSIHCYRGNLEETEDAVSSSEYVVASRFHAMVLGILYGKKVFPIVYSEKMTNALESYGVVADYIKIEEIEDLDVVRIEKAKSVSGIAVYKAAEQFARLDDFLK